MRIKNFRDILALVYCGVLLIWLVFAIVIFTKLVTNNPDTLDPLMALLTGLGLGGVTQFFIVIGTLIFQFYFRRAMPGETNGGQ